MPDIINQDVTIEGDGNIVVGKGNVTINPLPPAEAQNRAHLGILVKNVENTWIKGVLEKSVHEAALLDLGIEIQTDAVDHPWQMVLEAPNQANQVVPKGTKIKSVFNEANNLLLILGDPGSGKTTTLLQLARELINEIDSAFTQPVPVIFNLSTWIDQKQPLADWLIAELSSKYRTPKKQGRRWLEERRILPLLDGLDEVRPENREACVESINKLVVDYGLQGTVVCSRIKEYTALGARLQFNRAIYLKPLTNEQITEYFQRAGDKLKSVREVLERDTPLQKLARSPLMLNIMSLAYKDSSVEALEKSTASTDESRRQHLFDTYVARMFKRKGDKNSYNVEKTKERLSWLARNMQGHNQEIFLIEGLQPSWLQTRTWRIVYILIPRLVISGLIFGLSQGLIYELSFWLSDFVIGVRSGLIFGLTIGLIEILRLEWLEKRRGRSVSSSLWRSVKNIVIYMLSGGLIGWLSVFYLIDNEIGPIVGPIIGLFLGLRAGQRSLENDIQTVEALRWSWSKAFRGATIVGPIIGLIGGLIIGVVMFDLFVGLIFGLIVGLLTVPLLSVFYGLNREIIETKTIPNQGIHLSARSALLGGLIVWLIGGLMAGLFVGLFAGVFDEVAISGGLSSGLILGLSGAFWYGGFDIIQHYTLRLLLIIKGHTPRNYAHFLDHATDLILLQKVGGGYRFIHRMLLEHFSNMQEAKEKV